MLGLVRYHVPFVIDIGSRMVEVVGLVRDPLYTKEFRQMLRGAGLKPLLLAARSPNLNAYAERLVLSIKSECLDRIVPLGERDLRRPSRSTSPSTTANATTKILAMCSSWD